MTRWFLLLSALWVQMSFLDAKLDQGLPRALPKTFSNRLMKLEKARNALVSIKHDVNRSAYMDTEVSYKSGFILDLKRGWVVTTLGPSGYGATMATYEITFQGGQKLPAKSIYRDPLYNVEILEFDSKKNLASLGEIQEFSKHISLDQGTILLSKQNEQSIAQQGTVSNLYQVNGPLAKQVIRVSLNTPGSSLGGLAIDEQGAILGLVLHTDQTFSEVLWGGYVKEIFDLLKQGKRPSRPFFRGVQIESVSLSDAVKYLRFPQESLEAFIKRYPEALAYGLMVTRTQKKSSFALGDVIVSVNGQPVGPSLFKLQQLMASSGETVLLEVIRYGQKKKIQAPVLDAWDYTINKLIIFGGAVFYEADVFIHTVCNVPLRALMVSKSIPGSVFSGVFPSLPSREPVSMAWITHFDETSMGSLVDLERSIPLFAEKPYFVVAFQDYGCTLLTPKLVGSNRTPSLGLVDFIASTSIPEICRWSERKKSWSVEPIALKEQKCLIQEAPQALGRKK